MSEKINPYKVKYEILKELLHTEFPNWLERIDNLEFYGGSEYIELHIKFKIKIIGEKAND